MRLQEIRNATVKLTYCETTFLIDPWLAERGANGAFGMWINKTAFCANPASQDIINPMCDLPFEKEKILKGVDINLISHLHFDHIDIELAEDGTIRTVGRDLNKRIPTFVQGASDAAVARNSGFEDVRILGDDPVELNGITVIKTPCMHGFIRSSGDAMGWIFKHPDEPTIYFAGDTIWYDGVRKVLETWHPDIVVLNCCGASLLHFGRLIMHDEDLYQVSQAAPEAKIVAVHMDNVSHNMISREDLRRRVDSYGIGRRVLIPQDGEVLSF